MGRIDKVKWHIVPLLVLMCLLLIGRTTEKDSFAGENMDFFGSTKIAKAADTRSIYIYSSVYNLHSSVQYTAEYGSTVSIEELTKYFEENVVLRNENYTFDGLYESYNSTEELTGNIEVNFSNSLKIYAHWNPVKKHINIVSDGKVVNELEINYNSYLILNDIPVPEKAGHTFNYWSYEDGSEIYYSSIRIQDDLSIYANWKINYYNVTYYDGNEIVGRDYVPYGSPSKEITIKKDGYRLSWNKDLSCIKEDTIVKAKWTRDINETGVDYNSAKSYANTENIGYSDQYDCPAAIDSDNINRIIDVYNYYDLVSAKYQLDYLQPGEVVLVRINDDINVHDTMYWIKRKESERDILREDITGDETSDNNHNLWESINIRGEKGNNIKVYVEGNNHTIKDFTPVSPQYKSYTGLFGELQYVDLTVNNLNFEDVTLMKNNTNKSSGYGAALAGGIIDGNVSINNCHVKSVLYAGERGGAGLIYKIMSFDPAEGEEPIYYTAEIKNCSVEGSRFIYAGGTGGIIASAIRTPVNITNCLITEDNEFTLRSDKTYASNIRGFGGIAGHIQSGNITGCTNYADIRGNVRTGGIAGALEEGTISNCINYGGVCGIYISGEVGGISGYSGASINECYNLGTITGKSTVGGITGHNTGAIIGSASEKMKGVKNFGSIYMIESNMNDESQKYDYTGNESGYGKNIGGIAGKNGGTINNGVNYGMVRGIHGGRIGGIAGYNTSMIVKCMNLSPANTEGQDGVGGIAGENSILGNVQFSKSYSDVCGETRIGGIVGNNYGSVDNGETAINNKIIPTVKGNDFVGGIVGENSKSTSNQSGTRLCTNIARVISDGYAGGVVGSTFSMVNQCVNNGYVKSDGTAAGIAGFNNYTVKKCTNNGFVESENVLGEFVGDSSDESKYVDCINNGILNFSGDVWLSPESCLFGIKLSNLNPDVVRYKLEEADFNDYSLRISMEANGDKLGFKMLGVDGKEQIIESDTAYIFASDHKSVQLGLLNNFIDTDKWEYINEDEEESDDSGIDTENEETSDDTTDKPSVTPGDSNIINTANPDSLETEKPVSSENPSISETEKPVSSENPSISETEKPEVSKKPGEDTGDSDNSDILETLKPDDSGNQAASETKKPDDSEKAGEDSKNKDNPDNSDVSETEKPNDSGNQAASETEKPDDSGKAGEDVGNEDNPNNSDNQSGSDAGNTEGYGENVTFNPGNQETVNPDNMNDEKISNVNNINGDNVTNQVSTKVNNVINVSTQSSVNGNIKVAGKQIKVLLYPGYGNNTAKVIQATAGQVVKLDPISRTGYIFEGWYLQSDPTDYIKSFVPGDDTAVFAKWVRKPAKILIRRKLVRGNRIILTVRNYRYLRNVKYQFVQSTQAGLNIANMKGVRRRGNKLIIRKSGRVKRYLALFNTVKVGEKIYRGKRVVVRIT
ncbi:MAG: InlB B-repeat-containing protein [Lachnospiraceae bacterium]|nr:InlB B-repeat-containing protein [Lachnospiraceae bacterium]